MDTLRSVAKYVLSPSPNKDFSTSSEPEAHLKSSAQLPLPPLPPPPSVSCDPTNTSKILPPPSSTFSPRGTPLQSIQSKKPRVPLPASRAPSRKTSLASIKSPQAETKSPRPANTSPLPLRTAATPKGLNQTDPVTTMAPTWSRKMGQRRARACYAGQMEQNSQQNGGNNPQTGETILAITPGVKTTARHLLPSSPPLTSDPLGFNAKSDDSVSTSAAVRRGVQEGTPSVTASENYTAPPRSPRYDFEPAFPRNEDYIPRSRSRSAIATEEEEVTKPKVVSKLGVMKRESVKPEVAMEQHKGIVKQTEHRRLRTPQKHTFRFTKVSEKKENQTPIAEAEQCVKETVEETVTVADTMQETVEVKGALRETMGMRDAVQDMVEVKDTKVVTEEETMMETTKKHGEETIEAIVEEITKPIVVETSKTTETTVQQPLTGSDEERNEVDTSADIVEDTNDAVEEAPGDIVEVTEAAELVHAIETAEETMDSAIEVEHDNVNLNESTPNLAINTAAEMAPKMTRSSAIVPAPEPTPDPTPDPTPEPTPVATTVNPKDLSYQHVTASPEPTKRRRIILNVSKQAVSKDDNTKEDDSKRGESYPKLLDHRWEKHGQAKILVRRSHGSETWKDETSLHAECVDTLIAYWKENGVNGLRAPYPQDPELYDIFAVTGFKEATEKVLVEWTGFPKNQRSWEPIDTIREQAPGLVRAYFEEKGSVEPGKSKKRPASESEETKVGTGRGKGKKAKVTTNQRPRKGRAQRV